MKTVHYWFSPISPFTYFAGDRLEQAGVEVVYHPINIATVFAETGGVPVPKRSPQRQAYRLQEIARLSAKTGLPVNLAPKHFPVDSTLACQWLIVARNAGENIGTAAQALLKAVWAEDRDISDEATLTEMGDSMGWPAAYLSDAKGAAELLEKETAEAIEAGVFGSPFYGVDDQVFWGQEKIDEVVALARG